MNWKFFDILLQVAVALSFTAWNNQDDLESNLFGSHINSGIPNDRTNIQNSVIGPQSQTIKEEDVVNSIINWEEAQRANRFAPYTNLYAYPLVSQSFDQNLPTSEAIALSGRVLHSRETQNLPSPSNSYETSTNSSLSPSTAWPQSPGSSLDDGELFGAVGYTHENTSQYFDIESFLSANNSLEDINHEIYPDMVAGPRWVDQPLLQGADDSETVEELAQFLKDSLYDQENAVFREDKCSRGSSQSPKTAIFNRLDSYDDGLFDSCYQKHDASMVQSIATANGRIDDGKEQLGLLANSLKEEEDGIYKARENYIADVTSCKDAVKEPYNEEKQQFVTEYDSPYKEDFLFNEIHSRTNLPGQDKIWKTESNNFLEKYGFDDTTTWSKKEDVISKIPFSADQIIEMEIEEFNKLTARLDPLQQHLAKDMRRRGKNKLAARNCRKRKVDAIDSLDNNLQDLEQQKQMLLDEKLMLQDEKHQIQQKTQFLYEHLFKSLRDDKGLPYSETDFALTYTNDGNVYLVPKNVERKEIHSR